MAGVRPLIEFVQAFAPLAKEDFLARTAVPYLYFQNLPDLEQSLAFNTSQFRTMTNADTPVTEEGPPVDLGLQGIARLQKETGQNAFGMMVTVGRAANNDIVVPDKRVSKFHIYFRHTERGWEVTDASSTNGTVVDGCRLEPDRSQEVYSGSRIELSGAIPLAFLEPHDLYVLVQDFKAMVS